MTCSVPHNAVADVEPVVPFAPMPAKEIARLVDGYAPTTIKHALNHLADSGRILRCTYTNRYGQPINLYWRRRGA